MNHRIQTPFQGPLGNWRVLFQATVKLAKLAAVAFLAAKHSNCDRRLLT
jgi:hypothetical protein